MDLTSPQLGFPALAQGLGMRAEVIADASEIAGAMERAFAANAPYLLEIAISGKP
jgi:benzoylformate decarboxylase